MESVWNALREVQWGLAGARELINLHPLFVHFPVALLLAATGCYLLGAALKKNELLLTGKWVLYFGTLSAIPTVWTGLEAAKTARHMEGMHGIMMAHQYLGVTVLALSLGLSLWVFLSKASIPVKGKGLFLALLILMSGLLIQGADLGGRMVFLNGVGVGEKSMMRNSTFEHVGHGSKEGTGK